MRIVVLSPHLDDAVLSLGGSIAAWMEEGDRVIVATAFAGVETKRRLARHSLLKRQFRLWGIETYWTRREEEGEALARLGAEMLLGDLPEVLLRHPGASSVDELLTEESFNEQLHRQLIQFISMAVAAADRVYLPAGHAPHPDHRAVRRAAAHVRELLPETWVYEELPYASAGAPRLLARSRFELRHLTRKLEAIECYRSQQSVLAGPSTSLSDQIRERATEIAGPGSFAEAVDRFI